MFIELPELHKIFHNCFYTIGSWNDKLDEVREIFFKIFLNSTDSEEEIVAHLLNIKKIIQDKTVMERLKLYSKSAPKGSAFWDMFAIAFEKSDQLKKILVNRIKEFKSAITKEVKSLNKDSLDSFFSNSELPSAHKNVVSPSSFFKPSTDKASLVPVTSVEKISLQSSDVNLFCEKNDMNLPSHVADSIRAYREMCLKKVKAGELITQDFTIQAYAPKQYKGILHSNADQGPFHKYGSSLGFLLYDAVKDGRVADEFEAQKFCLEQIVKHPFFTEPNDMDKEELQARLLSQTKFLIYSQFKEAFEYYKNFTKNKAEP